MRSECPFVDLGAANAPGAAFDKSRFWEIKKHRAFAGDCPHGNQTNQTIQTWFQAPSTSTIGEPDDVESHFENSPNELKDGQNAFSGKSLYEAWRGRAGREASYVLAAPPAMRFVMNSL